MAGNAVIGALRVDLGLDTAAWEDGLKKVEGGMSGFAKTIAAGLAGITAAFGVGVTAAVQRLERMESSARKVDQVLANTGNSANTSAKEIAAWADELEMRTGRAGQEVMDVAANLASYGFGEEVFFRAIELADDMAAAWGGDLRQNLDGLARALENPEKGLAMLSARGITFSAEGRKMAIELAKAGKSAEAAGVLMDELEGQVKGAAEAGFGGLTKSTALAQKALDGFFEAIASGAGAGGLMAAGLDVAAAALNLLTNNLTNIIRVAGIAGATMAVAFGPAILASVRSLVVAVGTNLVAAFTALRAAIMLNPLGALAVAITSAVSALWFFRDEINVVADEIATLGDYIRAAWEIVSSSIGSAVSTITGYLSAVADSIRETFGEGTVGVAITAFGIIADGAKTALNLIIGLFVAAVNQIRVVWTKLPAAIGEVVMAVVQGVLGALEGMVNSAKNLVNGLIGGLNSIPGVEIPVIADVSFAGAVKNPFAGAASQFASDMTAASHDALTTDYLGAAGDALAGLRDRANAIGEARGAIDQTTSSVRALGDAADEALGGGGSGGKGGKGKKGGAGRNGLSKEAQEAARIFEQTRTPLERYQAQIARLNELLAAGAIDLDTYNRAVAQAQDEFDRATENAKQKTNDFASVGQTMATSLSSGFKSMIEGAKSFGEVLSDILGRLADMWMDKAFQMLFGDGGSGGGKSGGAGPLGAVGGFFKNLLGFKDGGSFQVGGAGGIDSQLVAFKASPNEQVSITKPGQERQSGGQFSVNVAPSPYFNVTVERISDRVAQGRVAQGQQAASRAFPTMQRDQQLRKG